MFFRVPPVLYRTDVTTGLFLETDASSIFSRPSPAIWTSEFELLENEGHFFLMRKS
jgi:hypothetical protein